MMKKMRTENAGFTLIEVILSIAILALISVPLIKYFTDSLGYSVKTQEKQSATLAAQEAIEFLKSQEVLMKWQGAKDGAGATVMHYNITEPIKQQFGVDLDQRIEQFDAAHPSPGYDRNSGKGVLTYDYSVTPAGWTKGFDLRVSLETDTGATEIARPIVYGIDDTTNVVAAEYNEEEDVVMKFAARNAAALIQQGGGYIVGMTPEPSATSGPMYTISPGTPTSTPDVTTTPVPYEGVVEQSEEEIRKNLRRTIHIELDQQEEILPLGTQKFYTVRVYYEYSCINITSILPSEPDIIFTDDIINTNVKELEGFYLMFNKVHPTEDVIKIHWIGTGGVNPPEGDYPEFRFICQDLSLPTASEITGVATPTPGAGATPAATTGATPLPGTVQSYVPTLYLENFTGWNWQPMIRTNIETMLLDNSSQIANKTLLLKELTESGNPVRVFKITVDVYRKGERDTGDPIVEMITSKTE